MNVIALLNRGYSRKSGSLCKELGVLSHDVDSPANKVLREFIAAHPSILGHIPEPRSTLQILEAISRVVDSADEFTKYGRP